MTEQLFLWLEEWGVWGVLLSLFIEGSAFPFIGTFFIVTVGFVLELTWFDLIWISLAGSFLYAVGSYIPYFIGYRLGMTVIHRLSEKRRKSLEQAQEAFSKYGIWSVAISSPLHLGNVIPFLAGISKMNLRTYTLLTMLGIAPSTFLLLVVGRFYTGDTETIVRTIETYQGYVLMGFVAITALYAGWKLYEHRKQKQLEAASKESD
ncbi:VTT domain-containing protein [Paenibacillus sp. TRM 82003]|nr:VTT domain-containing protein [Paenibacillus sp. TRM 82003]